MSHFLQTLCACPSDGCAQALKADLERLPSGVLPLYLATSQGGIIGEQPITATVFDTSLGETALTARVGVFFTEVVGGCNCHDDPLEANGYCELAVLIDRTSGEAEFTLLTD